MDENNVDLLDTDGFDMLNGKSLFVHYTNYRSKYTEEENKKLTEKYTNFLIDYTTNKEDEIVIAYPEENSIFIDNENFKMIGNSSYYIFEKGLKNKEDIN